jgi:hypothetical protein
MSGRRSQTSASGEALLKQNRGQRLKPCAETRKLHIGSLLELCYEEGSELSSGDEKRTFKGRVVFLADRANDQYGATAVFQEMASCPAGLEASSFCDAYGMLPDHVLEAADAEQAYIQADLPGGRNLD